MILTWREEIIDKITNGALTVWCEAVEKAISLIDGNRILDENIYISISDTSVNHSRESNELLTYCSLEGDDCTEISYYTNLPYSGLDSNEDEIKKLNKPYTKIRDGFKIEINTLEEATELIIKNKSLFKDYEVVKGKMDDVFLNATGYDLEVE